MTSTWHQNDPFNRKVAPNKAGCVAVAIGQIMKFNRHPSSYNWSNMEDDNYKDHEDVQNLMVDIGRAVNMDYGTDASGTTTANAKRGLEGFGYEVIKKDYNSTEVLNDMLTNKRPIYMDGSRTNAFIGLIYKDGHAWVCDGVKHSVMSSEYSADLIVQQGSSYSYISSGGSIISDGYTVSNQHLNWGWNDSQATYNGWYTAGTSKANGDDRDYHYGRKNFYIKPLR